MEIFAYCFTAGPLAYAMSVERMAMRVLFMSQAEGKQRAGQENESALGNHPPDADGERNAQQIWGVLFPWN